MTCAAEALAGLGLGALAAVIVLGLAASTDLLDRLELTTYDWRMRLAADPASVNKDIVLVEINDLSIRAAAGRLSHAVAVAESGGRPA